MSRPAAAGRFETVEAICDILRRYRGAKSRVVYEADFAGEILALPSLREMMAAEVLGPVRALAKERLPDDARMDAYYYGFERTGVGIVDAILSQVAIAGKGSHSTETWQDDPFSRGEQVSYQERIQGAANEAADRLRAALSAPVQAAEDSV